MHRKPFCQNAIPLPKAICRVFGEIHCATMSVMPPTRWTPLPSLAAVAVTGRDACSFLQGQVTNDLLGLARHPGLLTAACNRSGRVLEIMRLAAFADGILLIMPGSLAPASIARLASFVLRAQVSLAIRGDGLVIAGLLDAEPDPSWTSATAAAAGLTMMVASPRRILLAGSSSAVENALNAIGQTTPDDWDRACIEDGEPVIHPQTSGLWVPQMLNLDLLAAVSFTKGCYVGQEIVARIQHLGQIKRRMLRYVGPAGLSLQAGDTLYSDDSLAAQVVATSDSPQGLQLLAVVGLQYCTELLGCRPGGTELVPADLPYAIPAPDTESGT
jgi:folate-binding protein YgfZ